jgi:16S rRNA (guanine966-N2)-methyltransferase
VRPVERPGVPIRSVPWRYDGVSGYPRFRSPLAGTHCAALWRGRGMTRVIAGAAGGRRLTIPRGLATRPTSDRAREGLFGTAIAVLGGLEGARVLDLYAGSGAVGLEALSRGAAHALLVESAPAAVRVIRSNIGALALDGAAVAAEPVGRVLARGPGAGGPYGFVFADPPYAVADDEITAVLAALRDHGWLARPVPGGDPPGTLVAVERATRSGPVRWPDGYQADRSRRYGDATLWYGFAAAASQCPAI